jgi:serine/threonine protein phosphatase 1
MLTSKGPSGKKLGASEAHPSMAIWAVGDVHGCLDKLRRLWDRLSPNPEEEVIFLGDLIDRGPDSKGVLDFLLRKQRSGFRIVCLLGNHEEMCLAWYRDRCDPFAWEVWMANGGRRTLASYGSDARGADSFEMGMTEEHLEFLSSFPLWHRSGEVTFVHAGLRPGRPLEEQDREDLLWIREDFFGRPEAFPEPVVFGHTPFFDVFRSGPLVGIDTGAVYSKLDPRYGRLTAYDPLTDQVVQVV